MVVRACCTTVRMTMVGWCGWCCDRCGCTMVMRAHGPAVRMAMIANRSRSRHGSLRIHRGSDRRCSSRLRRCCLCRQPGVCIQYRIPVGFLRQPVEVPIPNTAPKTSFPTPFSTWCNQNLPADISDDIVHVKFQLAVVVAFDQPKQIIPLIQRQRIGSNDVVLVGLQAGCTSRRVLRHVQDVPNVFTGPFKGTVPDAQPEQSLPTPCVVWDHRELSHILVLAVVDGQFDRLVHILLCHCLELITIHIQSEFVHPDDKIEERFQPSNVTR